MGRWGLTDPELLKALDQDPELVRMVEHLAAESGETPNELLSRLAREELENELDRAFESPPGSRLPTSWPRRSGARCRSSTPTKS